MTAPGWLQIAFFLALVTVSVRPLGGYIARIFDGRAKLFRPVETALYRLAGVDPAREQSWHAYALGLLMFHLAGIAALYAMQRLQAVLPFNPEHLAAVPPDLALNTGVSFATNTSWQAYATRPNPLATRHSRTCRSTKRAATWKARRYASASPGPPCSPPLPPRRKTARFMPCTTASCRCQASCCSPT